MVKQRVYPIIIIMYQILTLLLLSSCYGWFATSQGGNLTALTGGATSQGGKSDAGYFGGLLGTFGRFFSKFSDAFSLPHQKFFFYYTLS